MTTYSKALENQIKAQNAYDKADSALQKANKVLEQLTLKLEIECDTCNHKTKVNEIEVIDQMSGGYDSYEYDGWIYHHNIFWVCSKCNEPQNIPEDKGPFKNGFLKYVKIVHKWYSDRERCHGRVLELLTPHMIAEEDREKKEAREKKIAEARKLLAEVDKTTNN